MGKYSEMIIIINKTDFIYSLDKAISDTSQTITLTEGVDILYLQVNTTSNPESTFTFQFNDTEITSPDHTKSQFLNSTTESTKIQSGMLLDGYIDQNNGGYYKIETCNIVGCKIDEYKVIINCK